MQLPWLAVCGCATCWSWGSRGWLSTGVFEPTHNCALDSTVSVRARASGGGMPRALAQMGFQPN